MIKVSVIIPVYNVQKYIIRCARSLFEQSLKEMEFIFVDDCSPDNSTSLVKQLLLDYPERACHTIFCQHNVNKGLPTARKTGLGYVHGKYIAHCDSDDWVCATMYEDLYEEANSGDYDIVSCDYFKSDGKKHDICKVSKHHPDKLMLGPVWNKLVKRTLYKDIIFPKDNKGEDGVIMAQLSYFAITFKHINTPYYYYYVNPESICRVTTKKACIERWKQECNNVELRIAFLRKMNAESKYHYDITMMKYYANSNIVPYLKDDTIYEMWKKSYPELYNEIHLCSCYPLRIKISYFLSKHRLIHYFKH